MFPTQLDFAYSPPIERYSYYKARFEFPKCESDKLNGIGGEILIALLPYRTADGIDAKYAIHVGVGYDEESLGRFLYYSAEYLNESEMSSRQAYFQQMLDFARTISIPMGGSNN